MTVLAQSGLTAEEHFNSHPHEEDDLFVLLVLHFLDYFNSHPHEEDDHGEYNEESEEYISTHILTKRMTTVSFLS